jgi:hypothetical protein
MCAANIKVGVPWLGILRKRRCKEEIRIPVAEASLGDVEGSA